MGKLLNMCEEKPDCNCENKEIERTIEILRLIKSTPEAYTDQYKDIIMAIEKKYLKGEE